MIYYTIVKLQNTWWTTVANSLHLSWFVKNYKYTYIWINWRFQFLESTGATVVRILYYNRSTIQGTREGKYSRQRGNRKQEKKRRWRWRWWKILHRNSLCYKPWRNVILRCYNLIKGMHGGTCSISQYSRKKLTENENKKKQINITKEYRKKENNKNHILALFFTRFRPQLNKYLELVSMPTFGFWWCPYMFLSLYTLASSVDKMAASLRQQNQEPVQLQRVDIVSRHSSAW